MEIDDVVQTMEIWDRMSRPPITALKTIKGGRLKGMSDINPQWRYEKMTEVFGPCGDGWWFNIVNTWTDSVEIQKDNDTGTYYETVQMAEVKLHYKLPDGGSSHGIPGVGGSKLATMEKYGVYVSDEAVKMAVTDALGTAMKMLGMASDIYMGLFDGSKYIDTVKQPLTLNPLPLKESGTQKTRLLADELNFIKAMDKKKKKIIKYSGDDRMYKETLGQLGYEHRTDVPDNKKIRKEVATAMDATVKIAETLND
jgi:hypothetical protein